MYVIIGGTGFLGTNIVRVLSCRTKEPILVAARNPVECTQLGTIGGGYYALCTVRYAEPG